MNQENSIAADVDELKLFGADLTAFSERFAGESLFLKPPPRELDDVTSRRLSEGRYLLRPCGCEFRQNSAGEIALDLLDRLDHHLTDRREALAVLRNALTSDSVDIGALLGSVFRNRGNEIMLFARHFQLEEDLVAFFAVCFARPARMQAAKRLLENVDLSAWRCGYCPVCGHWPSLGHIASESGQLTLWCMHCDTRWPFKRVQCLFCLTEEQEQLAVLAPEPAGSFRIHACKRCRRYLKEVRTDVPAESFPFLQTALGTVRLDFAAQEKKFIRESPLTVRYDDPDGNELLLYRQAVGSPDARSPAVEGVS